MGSEIATIDGKDYDDDRYTLASSKVCVNITDASLGIGTLQLRLVTPGGNVILKRNKEGGSDDELPTTCFTDDATQKRGKPTLPFGGDWKPKKGQINKLFETYFDDTDKNKNKPKSRSSKLSPPKLKVKDHVNKQNKGRT